MTDAATTAVPSASAPTERDERFAARLDALVRRRPGRAVLGNERFLLGAAGTLITIGLSVILLGWAGAAHSTIIEGQFPYLISGGMLGLALCLLGAFAFFSHWLTVLVRELRAHEAAVAAHHEELIRTLRELAADERTAARRSRRPLRSGTDGG